MTRQKWKQLILVFVILFGVIIITTGCGLQNQEPGINELPTKIVQTIIH